MTPLSRAPATSHAKFSMNQAGRRRQNEDALRAEERCGEGRGILHVRDRDLAALRGPGLALLDIANNSANGFVGSEQRAGHCSADLASYSGYSVHLRLLELLA